MGTRFHVTAKRRFLGDLFSLLIGPFWALMFLGLFIGTIPQIQHRSEILGKPGGWISNAGYSGFYRRLNTDFVFDPLV
jgi:hypothetical protein